MLARAKVTGIGRGFTYQVIQAGLGDTALFSVTSSCHTASLALNG